MTTLGIIGMGKMGTSIASILEGGGEIRYKTFARLSPDRQADLQLCDAVIEFTTSEAAPGIIAQCLSSGVPVVSGTTGWQEYQLENIKSICRQKNGKFLFASNFSIGMNITFAINKKLAMIMEDYPQFKVSILEKHHIHKKDAPSGTAYALINDIIDLHSGYDSFELNTPSGDKSKIPVTAIREGEIKGYHQVVWDSGLERITLSHEAFDRQVFAQGAIVAAKWLLAQKPGIYTMKDIIEV